MCCFSSHSDDLASRLRSYVRAGGKLIANYDASLYAKEDTIVAYATADGAMIADDGIFRMVLPDAEGKLNVRQLVEIVAIP